MGKAEPRYNNEEIEEAWLEASKKATSPMTKEWISTHCKVSYFTLIHRLCKAVGAQTKFSALKEYYHKKYPDVIGFRKSPKGRVKNTPHRKRVVVTDGIDVKCNCGEWFKSDTDAKGSALNRYCWKCKESWTESFTGNFDQYIYNDLEVI